MKYTVCAAKFCPRHLVSLSTALNIVGHFILKYPDWHWVVIFLSSPLPFHHIFFSFSFFPSFFPSFLFLPSLFLFPHSSFSTFFICSSISPIQSWEKGQILFSVSLKSPEILNSSHIHFLSTFLLLWIVWSIIDTFIFFFNIENFYI